VLIYLGLPKALYLKVASEMKQSGFCLNNVIIQGISNLPKQDVRHFIDYSDETFIFDVNPGAIAGKVQENPWVESCIIRRQLPNSLYIKVKERKPIASARMGWIFF
ncbi:MAG: FtsQ-type POTRA domain-containing protein, partial [Acidobacteria bacterium]|nr:FtsQ-type POTRA domain-containing protein [Acidobacteriota bacterium]